MSNRDNKNEVDSPNTIKHCAQRGCPLKVEVTPGFKHPELCPTCLNPLVFAEDIKDQEDIDN